jgi:hypothetical protein
LRERDRRRVAVDPAFEFCQPVTVRHREPLCLS